MVQGRKPAAAPTAPPRSNLRDAAAPSRKRGRPAYEVEEEEEEQQQEESDQTSSDAGSSGDDAGSGSDADADGGLLLGELVRLRQDGSTSAAALRARAAAARAHPAAPRPRRRDKHAPTELPSRRPVPVLRDAFEAGDRPPPRRGRASDPRFDPLAGGAFDEARFRRRYGFLYDEVLPAERRALAASAKHARPAKREALKAELARVTQQLRAEEARRRREAKDAAARAEERAAVAAGKRPFYPKRGELRRRELLARYEELRASGGLEAALAKRRRKNAAKDHRYLPSARRAAAGE